MIQGYITDEEWRELPQAEFATTAVLRAIDAIDEMCGEMNDSEGGRPPHNCAPTR